MCQWGEGSRGSLNLTNYAIQRDEIEGREQAFPACNAFGVLTWLATGEVFTLLEYEVSNISSMYQLVPSATGWMYGTAPLPHCHNNTDEHRAFAHNYWVEGKPRKNLNQVTCSDRESNPGHLISRPDALAVNPQVWTPHNLRLAFVLDNMDRIGKM
ncbi:hypothetical protein ANN_20807 [Periplaneta americana]|uniref:Uncharacterized protein n=1 Tax=Periplaneta americana TaxID=6978 RepID=A0ABQ8SDM8_PERAM|nr:hypothetical protein ANN_20807 [Periplaneta americana]